MERQKWIESYTEEKKYTFHSALVFLKSTKKYVDSNLPVYKIINKYLSRYTKFLEDVNSQTIPTEGEYNRVVNNRHFKKFFAKRQNSFNVGDLVYVRSHYGKRFEKIALITSVKYFPNAWAYSVRHTSSGEISTVPWFDVLKVDGRNLDRKSIYD
jgi:hypothetical protein